jgi:hypothetical protein
MTTAPCVIDIEASGFGRGSYPVEIGFVRADGSARCTLIRPPEDWTHWDGSAERLHGLTRELLLRHGRPAAEVAALLNDELAGSSVYCDNWAHDYAWLARLYDCADCSPSFRLRHLRELLSEAQAAQWDRACAEARAELGVDRHRASHDARILQHAWARLQNAAGNGPAPAPDEPVRR